LGIVRQDLLVKGEKGERKLNVLFDSGVSRSLIKSSTAKEVTRPRKLLIQRGFTKTADGRKFICRYISDLIVKIKGRKVGVETFLVDNLPVPLVFGALDMEAYMIKLDPAKRRLDLSEFTGYMPAV
jgi:hypothetical protein